MAESYPPLRFTWYGQAHEHQPVHPALAHEPHSWPYDNQPPIAATIPTTSGGTVAILGHAERWGDGYVLIRWVDDDEKTLSCWVLTAAVHKLTPSRWDIEQYWRCPPHLRGVQWGNRLPGFLPE